eukprot:67002-Rhodomonas_salina.1
MQCLESTTTPRFKTGGCISPAQLTHSASTTSSRARAELAFKLQPPDTGGLLTRSCTSANPNLLSPRMFANSRMVYVNPGKNEFAATIQYLLFGLVRIAKFGDGVPLSSCQEKFPLCLLYTSDAADDM